MQQWWTDCMATVWHPLQEKLTLFWHGHFETSQDQVNRAEARATVATPAGVAGARATRRRPADRSAASANA